MASPNSPENMWIKFFSEAGLPSGVSASYALTFTDNRIQMNMLLDLNKEYLTEMGITCMGDVIAILRHAKHVHEETARDRVLGITGPRVPVAAVAGRPGLPKANTPATRMLEHYTRNTPQNVSPTNSVSSVKERLGGIRISATKRKVTSPNLQSLEISSPMDTEADDGDIITKRIRQTISQKNIYDLPSSKVTSDTSSAQKNISSNVFLRLGSSEEGRVTSSNITKSAISAKTAIKRGKPSTPTPSKTVFSRLGDKGADSTTTRREFVDSEPLKYEGILKASPPTKKVVLKIPVISETFKNIRIGGTMRADEAPISVKEKLSLSHPQRKSVKFSPHVDYKEIEKRPINNDLEYANNILTPEFPITNGRTVALSHTKTLFPSEKNLIKRIPITLTQTNIKMRLGKTNPFIKKQTKPGVFGRLGLTSKH